jgi:hypothetical protein
MPQEHGQTHSQTNSHRSVADNVQPGGISLPAVSVLQAVMDTPVNITKKKGSAKGVAPAAPGGGARNYTAGVNEEREKVRTILTHDTRLIPDAKQIIRAHIIPHRWGGPGDLTNIVPWVSDVHEDEWENGQEQKMEALKDLDAGDDITFTGTANYSPHLTSYWLRPIERRMKKLSVEGKASLQKFYDEVYEKRKLIPSSASLTANGTPIAEHKDTSSNFKIDTTDERVKNILKKEGWDEVKKKEGSGLGLEEEEDSDEEVEENKEDKPAPGKPITERQVEDIMRNQLNLRIEENIAEIKQLKIDKDEIGVYKSKFIETEFKELSWVLEYTPDIAEKYIRSATDKAFTKSFKALIRSKKKTDKGPEKEPEKDITPSSGNNNATPRSSWCFITTACVRTFNLPDDCHELTVLRKFRDEYMMAVPNGPSMIQEYYRIAPAIVQEIDLLPDPKKIYAGLFKVIQTCVDYIEHNKKGLAIETYKAMVIRLKEEYLHRSL